MPETALRTDADFEAFYERHWQYVYRLCFSYLQSEADAVMQLPAKLKDVVLLFYYAGYRTGEIAKNLF